MELLRQLFSFRGRISRGDFRYAVLLVLSVFVVAFVVFESAFGRAATWVLYPPAYWSLLALAVKRHHDIGRSAAWLLLAVIPILGPLWLAWSMFCRKGMAGENRYGTPPGREQLDYLAVGENGKGPATVLNDVTGLNRVEVARAERPTSAEEVAKLLKESTGPVSVGGGRFSMGGQTSCAGSLHLDMRGMNRILAFDVVGRTVRVEAGVRWCDLQKFLDPHDLSVKIMQTYANLTVGGSLNVNAHGRYMGLGPVVLSVRDVRVVLADGSVRDASRDDNAELFFGVIGGYGGLGVIVEATLEVVPNTRVACVSRKMATADYPAYFDANVRADSKAVFHNADLYPPDFTRVRSQTWVETDKKVTQTNRLMALRSSFPVERYFLWAVSETPFGKWRREYLIDPVLFFSQKVHYRNYEAGYDVAELEPASRAKSTYTLQEYFVPVARFSEFVPLAAEILQRHGVNVINISVRHALPDPGTLLAWAREEVFAFVLYSKQGTSEAACAAVGVWTRELVEAALSLGGTYYLPYQPHATPEQFRRAYPRAGEYMALKRRLDPHFRFRNALWNKYYDPDAIFDAPPAAKAVATAEKSEFRRVFGDQHWRDKFFFFLQNIFHLHPEDKFHHLIHSHCKNADSDVEIYKKIQAALPSIKPLLAPLTHALPALRKQKREMLRQTLALLGDRKAFDGYAEIGSVGRYISVLRHAVTITGPVHIVNDVAPTNSPGDVMERGGFKQQGTFSLLDYGPLDEKGISPGSLDLVTCYIGLHHAPDDKLAAFVRSVRRVLRAGGLFVMRDHDVKSPEMATFVSLVHTVFNLGLGVPCETDAAEFKSFRSCDEWSAYLSRHGFRDRGARLYQANDPTDNVLMCFERTAEEVPS